MEIQTLKHDRFGEVRLVELEGAKWYVARDIAAALGYARPEISASRHVPEKNRQLLLLRSKNSGAVRKTVVIDEEGLRALCSAAVPFSPSADDLLAWLLADDAPVPDTDIKDIVSIEWSNRLVLTTAQLADFYGASIDNIQRNFNRNRDRFFEGKHFFRLEGEGLRQFKRDQSFCPIAENVNVLYLWTRRGAARHAKMLNTDKAWEMFEALEENYFNRCAAEPVIVEEPKKRKARSDTAHVYAFNMSNALTKIGNSDNIADRIRRIESDKGLKVMHEHHTPKMPRQDAMRIERTLHRKYARFKVEGEFFNADYADICAALDKALANGEFALIEESETITPAELLIGKELF